MKTKAERKAEKKVKKELEQLVEGAKDIRSRIVGHKKVKAKDLIANELNFRTHSEKQKDVLRDIYDQIGYARSLLVYEVEVDGERRYKLIDGHCRQSLDPEMTVTVEILNVNEDEAHTLLASMDPSSALAETDAKILRRLLRKVGKTTSGERLTGFFSELSELNGIGKPEDIEIDIEGDGSELPDEEDFDPTKTSHVRMMQLFLDTKTLPEMKKIVGELMTVYGADSETDCIMRVLRRAHKDARKSGKIKKVKEPV